MPIQVTNRYYNEFRPEAEDFLLGNIGEIIRIERDVEIQNYAIADNDNEIIRNYTNGMIGQYWIYDPRGQFKDFKVGDVLEMKNYVTDTVDVASMNIVAKINEYHIQVDQDTSLNGSNDQYTSVSIFNNKTAISALKYKWNFIENDEADNFLSKIDGSEQMLEAPSIDATAYQTSGALVVGQKYIISDFNAGDDFTNVGAASNATGVIFTATGTTPTTYTNGSTLNKVSDMNFVGSKCYQTGSALIYGTGINTVGVYGFKFTIIHYTKILPVFLAEQYTDFTNEIAPDYFLNTKCLKDIQQFIAMYDYNDPNRDVVQSFSETEGNTGWFNENFNNGITNYFIDSIVFKKPDTTVIPGILYSLTETTFEIVVKNTINAPFSNNNTKFSVNFVHCPVDEDDYKNNGKTFDENFRWDHVFNTVGSAAVNGDNFGTSYQIFKDVAATFISTSEIKITGKIAMDGDLLAFLSNLDAKRYFLFVGVQKHSLATINADRVHLFEEIAEFYEDAEDPDMILFDHIYLRHYESDPLTEGTTDFETFPEDELVAYVNIDIDHAGRYQDELGNDQYIQLVSAEAKIKAKNSVTLEEFDLDTSGIISLLGYPIINDNTFVQYSNPRGFHVPSAEVRKNILFERKPLLDAGDYTHYIMQFPFIMRWEYFIANAAVDHDFFNVSQPNNGLNNNWQRISSLLADWKIYFECKVKARKVVVMSDGTEVPGATMTYSHEDQCIKIWDYESRPPDSYLPHSIKTFTYPGGTELYDSVSGDRFILGFADTKVEATFERPLAVPIDLNYVEIRLWIEEYEAGGRDGSRRISTIWPLTSDTWFKSITTNDLADLALNQVAPIFGGGNDTVTANCLIDFNKIPVVDEFKICARLYDPGSVGALARITEDGQLRITEDAQVREVEV